MLNERKLTENELEQRKIALKGLLKNKRALVQKYGGDAEKVMYGIATKQAQKKVENMNLDKIKEMIQDALIVKESSPFVLAADAAKDAGKKEFEFPKGSGKMHPVTIKKDIEEDYLDVDDTKNNDTGFSGRADYGEEDKALDNEDELEMKGLEEDLDIGHQDDEPGMLKAELARAGQMIQMLYRAVDKYDGEGEVDFPQWWQAKIIKANAMLDSAFDYLDGKEMVAKIDAMIDVIDEDISSKNYAKGIEVIKNTLSKEGGAAGLEPLVKELLELGFKKEDVVKLLKSMTSVKQHRDGDYILLPLEERIDYDESLTLRGILADLKKEREQLFRDMEQEAEPEGGPIADRYGDELNKLEDRMYKIAKQLRDYDMNEATRQDLGMVSSISKSRAKSHLKNPSDDGSKVYGLDKDGKRVHIKSINDVDKFKKFELDADLNEGTNNEKEIKGQELVDYIMKNWNWSEEKTLNWLADNYGKGKQDDGPKEKSQDYIDYLKRSGRGNEADKLEKNLKEETFEDEIERLKDIMYVEQLSDGRFFIHPLDKPGVRRPSRDYIIIDGNNVVSIQGHDSGPIQDLADIYNLEAGTSQLTPMGKINAQGRISLLSSNILKDAIKAVKDARDVESKRQKDYYQSRGPVSGIGNMDERISSAVREKLTKKSSVEDHIDDFKDSDAPQFKGKSLKKIKQMALASFLSKQKK